MTLKKLEDKIKTLETRLEELEGQIYSLKSICAAYIPTGQAQIEILWHRHLCDFLEDPEGMEKTYERFEEEAREEYERIKKVLKIENDSWEEISEYLEYTKRKFNEALEMYPELIGKFEPPKA